MTRLLAIPLDSNIGTGFGLDKATEADNISEQNRILKLKIEAGRATKKAWAVVIVEQG